MINQQSAGLADAVAWPIDARPRVGLAGYYPIDPSVKGFRYLSSTHALHLHEYAGEMRLGGRRIRLEPGTLTLSPADVISTYDLPRRGMHWCIHVHPPTQPAAAQTAEDSTVRLKLCPPAAGRRVEAEMRFAYIAKLHAQWQRGGGTAVAQTLAVAMQELMLWWAMLDKSAGDAAGYEGLQHAPHPALSRLTRFVLEHLEQKLSVPVLAEHVGLSQNYLARLFRRHYGMSIPRYILTQRIESARLLLTTTDLPVKHIAARVGLSDPHHFNKQVRAMTGLSPTALRERGA